MVHDMKVGRLVGISGGGLQVAGRSKRATRCDGGLWWYRDVIGEVVLRATGGRPVNARRQALRCGVASMRASTSEERGERHMAEAARTRGLDVWVAGRELRLCSP
jgi:hypothetical protein